MQRKVLNRELAFTFNGRNIYRCIVLESFHDDRGFFKEFEIVELQFENGKVYRP